MKFHHVGIACESIEETKKFVLKNFRVVEQSPVIFDANQNAHLCILRLEDGSRIELVSGLVVNNFIKKNQFLYHTCWEVEDIEAMINKLSDDGATLISAPKPAPLFDDRLVAFLIAPIGIVEILQVQK